MNGAVHRRMLSPVIGMNDQPDGFGVGMERVGQQDHAPYNIKKECGKPDSGLRISNSSVP
jgi:ribosome biogenesis protein Nip4